MRFWISDRKRKIVSEKMNSEIRTTVLMINYNGLPDLPDLMNSLEAQTTRNFNPVFWDNASTDGSVEYVRENFPWVKI